MGGCLPAAMAGGHSNAFRQAHVAPGSFLEALLTLITAILVAPASPFFSGTQLDSFPPISTPAHPLSPHRTLCGTPYPTLSISSHHRGSSASPHSFLHAIRIPSSSYSSNTYHAPSYAILMCYRLSSTHLSHPCRLSPSIFHSPLSFSLSCASLCCVLPSSLLLRYELPSLIVCSTSISVPRLNKQLLSLALLTPSSLTLSTVFRSAASTQPATHTPLPSLSASNAHAAYRERHLRTSRKVIKTLRCAARSAETHVLERYLGWGFPVDSPLGGSTMLLISLRAGHWEMAEMLLRRYSASTAVYEKATGDGPLHVVAQVGRALAPSVCVCWMLHAKPSGLCFALIEGAFVRWAFIF